MSVNASEAWQPIAKSPTRFTGSQAFFIESFFQLCLSLSESPNARVVGAFDYIFPIVRQIAEEIKACKRLQLVYRHGVVAEMGVGVVFVLEEQTYGIVLSIVNP